MIKRLISILLISFQLASVLLVLAEEDIGLTAKEYLQLDNNQTIWLILKTDDLDEDHMYFYQGQPMFWSVVYNAYAHLIITNTDVAYTPSPSFLSIEKGNATSINYDGDINKSGKLDTNDAQTIYNIYTSFYHSFSSISIEKFLCADINGDKTVNVSDALSVLGIARNESNHLTVVPDGYIGIYTKDDLASVRNNLNRNYILMNNIEFSEADFDDGGIFYNEGCGWIPLGETWETPFTGIFDGNNYTIHNLLCNDNNNDIFAGLFGFNAGTIQNLTIANSKITSSLHYAYIGGVAGKNDGIIINCTNNATIIDQTSTSIIGGIAGENYGEIYDCNNLGTVCGNIAGGICGGNYGELRNDANNGKITGIIESGGVAGVNTGFIQSAYNEGTIIAQRHEAVESSDSFWERSAAGGIVGRNETDGTVQYCHNIGTVIVETINCVANAGGIVGWNYHGLLSLCSNYGNITSNDITGGIVGSLISYETTLTNCYNAGTVEGNCAGGITGESTSSLISGCYNVGSIKANTFGGAISGYSIDTSLQYCYHINTVQKCIGNSEDESLAYTSEQLKQIETYIGFDFDTIWFIDSTTIYPYPQLVAPK